MGIEALGYLADDFDEQAEGSPPEHAQDYRAFADYLRALPAAGVRAAELGELLRPFLADDPRPGGTLYPDGDAIRFMDSFVPDGDPEVCEQYLDEFLDHLRADHRRWSAHVAVHGADAAWTLETGRPEADVRLLHFETQPTSAPPRYESWEHYLASTTPAERRAMCAPRTKKANAARLMSAAPERRVIADDVWRIVEAAKGRCAHCGSLCLEKPPYDPVSKKKLPWGMSAGGSAASRTSYRGRAVGRTTPPTWSE
ncbi:MAG: hypothetical protein M3Y33_01415 [Actinomycetota bacterium]|nr:hypothetical protein [Actinomycetota bacterium]